MPLGLLYRIANAAAATNRYALLSNLHYRGEGGAGMAPVQACPHDLLRLHIVRHPALRANARSSVSC